jgi:hypothetical protein
MAVGTAIVFCVHLHLLWRDSLFIMMIVADWIESVVGKVAIRRAGQKPTKHIHPIRDTPSPLDFACYIHPTKLLIFIVIRFDTEVCRCCLGECYLLSRAISCITRHS